MALPDVTLYELGPTRSARCRWTLLEAGVPWTSLGNSPEVLHSDELLRIHPLGKLPAARIDGQPLFESAAICTAIADRVPRAGLIAAAGTIERAQHDQWVAYALTELEAWAWTAELNSMDFVIPAQDHVKAIIPQCEGFYRKAAAGLAAHLSQHDWLVGGRFSVTDIIVAYALNFGDEFNWLDDQPALLAYMERLFAREHCTLVRHR